VRKPLVLDDASSRRAGPYCRTTGFCQASRPAKVLLQGSVEGWGNGGAASGRVGTQAARPGQASVRGRFVFVHNMCFCVSLSILFLCGGSNLLMY